MGSKCTDSDPGPYVLSNFYFSLIYTASFLHSHRGSYRATHAHTGPHIFHRDGHPNTNQRSKPVTSGGGQLRNQCRHF